MKKIIMILVAIAAVLLMVSSATAVPQTSSQVVVKKVSQVEKIQAILDEKLGILKENPSTLPIGGWLAWLIAILLAPLDFAAAIAGVIAVIIYLIGIFIFGW